MGELRIFLNPKAYIRRRAPSFFKFHRQYGGESSGPSCTSPYFLHTSSYFVHISLYFFIFSAYFLNRPHIPSYFHKFKLPWDLEKLRTLVVGLGKIPTFSAGRGGEKGSQILGLGGNPKKIYETCR